MTPPPPIRILSDHVINKIAAGEVVERPASALKELIENAIDAGATHIEIEAVDGGKKLLRITDNGSGMDRDNALLAIERHATSKIQDVDDIERVGTLGFRGEALAAIASVSRFTLTTRPHDQDEGTRLQLSGGKLLDVSPAGAPPGTSIEIRNLFFNVPARRKFLRATATEQQHIRTWFHLYAISHPAIHFRLTFDEREVAHLPPADDTLARIRELYGPDHANALLPLSLARHGYHIHGFTSLPTHHRADRQEQLIFINGRPASAAVIGYALSQAYQGQLPRGRHPVCHLFIQCEPELVDVNVHPMKKEVRFRNASEIRDLLIEAISIALRGPQTSSPNSPPPATATPPVTHRPFTPPPRPQGLPNLNFPTRKPHIDIGPLPSFGPQAAPRVEPPPSSSTTPPPPSTPRHPWPHGKLVGKLKNGFAIIETEAGMILMNPQAAHERILFERFMKALGQAGQTLSQGLLQPETITLPPLRAGLIAKWIPELEALGFGISPFGGDTFLVDALPACLADIPAQSLLPDLAAQLEQGGKGAAGKAMLHEHVARIACARSVQGTTDLHDVELYRLLEELAQTAMPYTCPHGKPTVILTSWQELDRKFGKT